MAELIDGIYWGSADGNGYGRIGISYTRTESASAVSGDVNIYLWTKYSVYDNVNQLYFNGSNVKNNINIRHSVDSGGGWSTSNRTLLHSTTYSFSRGSTASSSTLSASLHTIEVL